MQNSVNVVRISDGLGNQMFQYAFARKLQILSKKKVYLDIRYINHEDMLRRGGKDVFHKKCDDREYALGYYKISLPIASKYILENWKYMEQNTNIRKIIYQLSEMRAWPWLHQSEFENDINDINGKKSIYYQGNYFDLRYFDDIKMILQKEFCPKKSIGIPAELRTVLEKENTVSIHVRRGDFIKVFRDISCKDYYPKAIEKISEYIENPTYLVFSDDIEWVEQNLKIDGEILYVSAMGLKDYEEQIIMKHCRHNIIANSTFSYWAAYLNQNPEKIVICPKGWKSKAIPKEWICV